MCKMMCCIWKSATYKYEIDDAECKSSNMTETMIKEFKTNVQWYILKYLFKATYDSDRYVFERNTGQAH